MTYYRPSYHHLFLSPSFYHSLSDNQSNQLKLLIDQLCKQIIHQRIYINKYKRKLIKYKNRLIQFGLNEHGKINHQSTANSTIRRRVKHVSKCIDALDLCLNDLIDLRQHYLLYEYKINPGCFGLVEPKMKVLWMKDQIQKAKQEFMSEEQCRKLAVSGVLSGLTCKQYYDLYDSVKLYMIIFFISYFFVFLFLYTFFTCVLIIYSI